VCGTSGALGIMWMGSIIGMVYVSSRITWVAGDRDSGVDSVVGHWAVG